ncbi:hypothetical protein EYC80_008890 [Monilinia laxa]|uniref:Uncharacterized protein n=1 Tax=Monilinia laxa TaxID=61186 RepID=A0A5N6K273_MONLA|nr:hypothetical protein EYC80_008890 [Monilinia laxa]
MLSVFLYELPVRIPGHHSVSSETYPCWAFIDVVICQQTLMHTSESGLSSNGTILADFSEQISSFLLDGGNSPLFHFLNISHIHVCELELYNLGIDFGLEKVFTEVISVFVFSCEHNGHGGLVDWLDGGWYDAVTLSPLFTFYSFISLSCLYIFRSLRCGKQFVAYITIETIVKTVASCNGHRLGEFGVQMVSDSLILYYDTTLPYDVKFMISMIFMR